jgi:hypothetical protein
MICAEMLVDSFDRVRGLVHDVVGDLDPGRLTARLDPEANTIAWLVWHLTRVQDDHIAAAAATEQVWTTRGWFERFGLPFGQAATGYGMNPEEVGAVRVAAGSLLTDYHDDVCARTKEYVGALTDTDLDRVVDENWDPPVTLGVRLVSVIGDDLQHAGQAALIRGILLRA